MPLTNPYPLPSSPQDLPLPLPLSAENNRKPEGESLFVCFISGNDAATNAPWCPDVRAAMPRLERIFGRKENENENEKEDGEKGEKKVLLCVQVGGKEGWKDPENVYRKQWGVKALPQLVRYQRVGGEVKATGELVENEVNDDEKLAKFVGA